MNFSFWYYFSLSHVVVHFALAIFRWWWCLFRPMGVDISWWYFHFIFSLFRLIPSFQHTFVRWFYLYTNSRCYYPVYITCVLLLPVIFPSWGCFLRCLEKFFFSHFWFYFTIMTLLHNHFVQVFYSLYLNGFSVATSLVTQISLAINFFAVGVFWCLGQSFSRCTIPPK